MVVEIFPETGMTLMMAGEVMDSMEDIVVNHHWTFASLIGVVDAERGRLGHMWIRYLHDPIDSHSAFLG